MKLFRYFLALLAFATFFVSCQKTDLNNDPTATTTVQQDKDYINQTSNETITCIKGVENGVFSQTLVKFLGLVNGNLNNENWADSVSTGLDDAAGGIELDSANSKFNYNFYKGTYNWNRVNRTFVRTPSNTITVNFPSEPNQVANNMVFKFTDYTDGLYQINALNEYLPTLVKATVDKNGEQIASVSYNAVYGSGSFPTPNAVTFNLFLKPHNYRITVNRITNLKFGFKIELGGLCDGIAQGTVTFLNDDYNNLDIEEDLSTVEMTYTSQTFKVVTNWNAQAYYAFNNPTTNNTNSTFTSIVYKNDSKIGELKLRDINANDSDLFIYYKDGTFDNVSVYTDTFVPQLKNILRPYFGNDVDDWF
jgi:hypothetical protein